MTRRSDRFRTGRRRSAPTCRRRRSSTSSNGATPASSAPASTPTRQLQLTTSFKTQKHAGELPWGASFGFSNDVEVALPYTSRTNDFNIGAEWSNQQNMLRVAYDGSWFTNHDDTLVWDSPLRLDDSSSTAPGRGRMSLWPTNQAQTFSVAGSSKLARRTQVTGFVSYGLWSNDSTLQPFTINSQLPVFTLPRPTAEAEAHVFSTNIGIVSRPADDWRVTARLRTYNFDNQMPATTITDYVSYDSSVKHLAYQWAVRATPTRVAPSRRMRRGPA